MELQSTGPDRASDDLSLSALEDEHYSRLLDLLHSAYAVDEPGHHVLVHSQCSGGDLFSPWFEATGNVVRRAGSSLAAPPQITEPNAADGPRVVRPGAISSSGG